MATASTDEVQIVFSFDCTASMYPYLAQVRNHLKSMVQDLKNNIPGIVIAIFAHGDYDTRWITKKVDFTNDANKLCRFVEGVDKHESGQSWPECYELVLHEVQDLSWRDNSQKSLVMIGDATPHEPNDGWEQRGIDWRKECEKLREKDIKIYAVQCGKGYPLSRRPGLLGMFRGLREPEKETEETYFYNYIASRTFGHHHMLASIEEVTSLLKKICFREAGLIPPSDSVPSVSEPSPMPRTIEKKEVAFGSPDGSLTSDDGETGLICLNCKVGKLSNEFPPTTLTEDCEHATGICLRCVIALVNENGICPHDKCGKPVKKDSMEMQWFQAILDEMFLDYSKVIAANRMGPVEDGGSHITVATLNGDTIWIPFDPCMSVEELKKQIQKEFGLEPKQQKLLFQEQGMKAKKGARLCTLGDYNVEANSTIYLLVPLYCVPEDLDQVVFDLSWGFPEGGVDFLDATCFAFHNNEFIQVIDWNHPTNTFYLKDSIRHSEENINSGRSGHQSINVHLKSVPDNITHLYFTLSSWKSPNLSAFSNPSLQFFDASDSTTDLCETTFGHALSSQAVIMCSVVRSGELWNIFECDGSGALVDGNSKKYNPIRRKISEMIKEDMD